MTDKQTSGTQILNWYESDPRLIEGLKERLNKAGEKESFITVRLGPKYADRFNPGDYVAISVSDDPDTPNIIGTAQVLSITKTLLIDLTDERLKKNIGAKTQAQAWGDMEQVYNKHLDGGSVVSILELI